MAQTRPCNIKESTKFSAKIESQEEEARSTNTKKNEDKNEIPSFWREPTSFERQDCTKIQKHPTSTLQLIPGYVNSDLQILDRFVLEELRDPLEFLGQSIGHKNKTWRMRSPNVGAAETYLHKKCLQSYSMVVKTLVKWLKQNLCTSKTSMYSRLTRR